MTKWWSRALDTIEASSKVLGTIGVYGILGLIGFMTFGVIMRYAFNKPLAFGEEVTGYILALIVFLGLAYVVRVGGHVSTDVLTRHLSPRVNRMLVKPVFTVGVVFGTILAAAAWLLVVKNYVRQVTAYGTLQTPSWIPMLLFGIGATMLLLQLTVMLVRRKTR